MLLSEPDQQNASEIESSCRNSAQHSRQFTGTKHTPNILFLSLHFWARASCWDKTVKVVTRFQVSVFLMDHPSHRSQALQPLLRLTVVLSALARAPAPSRLRPATASLSASPCDWHRHGGTERLWSPARGESVRNHWTNTGHQVTILLCDNIAAIIASATETSTVVRPAPPLQRQGPPGQPGS